jgi:glucose-6-phosphate dehydrogenase assembly protein OpcA
MSVQAEEWTGADVTIAGIERELAELREATYQQTEGPDLRTNVLTHLAWVPQRWRGAADEVLAQLAERHPSRTIVLTPRADEKDGLDAELSVQCFPLPGNDKNVCSEVIELALRGSRCHAPASIVEPLLIPDLPVFLRWRGRPPFGAQELEQLVGVADRLVIDSSEWDDLPGAYGELASLFDRVAVSDIAWSRTTPWCGAIAKLWPAVRDTEALKVTGPRAESLLLVGWLRSRLRRQIRLERREASALEGVEVDAAAVDAPPAETRGPADLLSDELEVFSRDPIYEAAVRAAE